MMAELIRRGEEIARARQRETVGRIAERLTSLLGAGAVEIEEARVLVRGRGLIRRWLVDPSFRFLAGALK
jgi:hypothetical protein